MDPEDLETRIAERSGFFFKFSYAYCSEQLNFNSVFFVNLCIVNPLIASNTTTNAVGCGEVLTFNGEKIISHAKPNKRAEEQELFGLPECN